MLPFHGSRTALVFAGLFWLSGAVHADDIGQATALVVHPVIVVLTGPRDTQQLVILGRYADGSQRDLTRDCELSADPAGIIDIQSEGLLSPRQDGTTTLTIQAGPQTAKLTVTVRDFARPQPISFRRDMMAALNISGCNGGSCHGIPSGRNGFRLSLWGGDPAFDFEQLTREMTGRRTNSIRPDDSLILQKALGRVQHEGGKRFGADSLQARIFRDWQAEGIQNDPADLPALTGVDVFPSGVRVLNAPTNRQQLSVRATFADGRTRDVTRLTVYSSSDPAIASISLSGLVEFHQPGEVAILCRYLDQMKAVRLMHLKALEGFSWPNPPENNYVDQHVFAKLKLFSIAPSELCSDAEFVRRVYLDVCGILPNADEVRGFLKDTDPDKRGKLIDALLERPEYADFWALKWADVLRCTRKFIQPQGAKAYHDWVRDHVKNNTPFDQVMKALILSVGHSYKDPPVNYYTVIRAPLTPEERIQHDMVETTAQLFLGIRIKCAKCHNHPFERWTQDDYHGLAAFFTQVQQTRIGKSGGVGNPEHRPVTIQFDPGADEWVQPRTGKAMKPKFLGGAIPDIADGQDRRELLAEWLGRPDNPFFARSLVNRIWFHLNGRGIVDAVDDFRESNPSANDALLDALAKDFVAHKFDMKHVIRVVLKSRTYQLSARTNAFNRDDAKYFSHVLAKPLTAEQLFDAVCTATGVPEPFEGVPLGTRAIQLPDGEVHKNPSRYLNYDRHPFMKTFGQPDREMACECAREGEFTLTQAMEMLNGETIAGKLRQPNNRIGQLLAKTPPPGDAQILQELYLTTLSRLPAEATVRAFLAHVSRADDKRKAWEDVLWTILRSKEFIYRH
jgi:hypothetical protein